MKARNRIEIVDQIDDDGTVGIVLIVAGVVERTYKAVGLNEGWDKARSISEGMQFPVYPPKW